MRISGEDEETMDPWRRKRKRMKTGEEGADETDDGAGEVGLSAATAFLVWMGETFVAKYGVIFMVRSGGGVDRAYY